jgi:hypothetical protein
MLGDCCYGIEDDSTKPSEVYDVDVHAIVSYTVSVAAETPEAALRAAEKLVSERIQEQVDYGPDVEHVHATLATLVPEKELG